MGAEGAEGPQHTIQGGLNTRSHFMLQAPVPVSCLAVTFTWIRTDLLCPYDRKKMHTVRKKKGKDNKKKSKDTSVCK